MKRLIVSVLATLLLGACTQADQWTLTFRQTPAQGQWQFSDIAGYYQSLEQCQAKGEGLRRLAGDTGQYQCAQQCEAEQGLLSCALIAPSTSFPSAQESQ